ncbi:MAG TPA: hypothetical protein VGG08_02780 [Solirubrobacteraceae bacterium]
MSESERDRRRSSDTSLRLSLDEFTRQALALESERLGVPGEELAMFAVAYYLADLHSGRIARRIVGEPLAPEIPARVVPPGAAD